MVSEKISFAYPSVEIIQVRISGDWRISAGVPPVGQISAEFSRNPQIKRVVFEVGDEFKWDSGFISFLLQLVKECKPKNIGVSRESLPKGSEKLLSMVLKNSAEVPAPPKIEKESFLAGLGGRAVEINAEVISLLDFLGQLAAAFGRLLRGKAYFRRNEFVFIIQRSGIGALGLVSLISVLVGVILAFVGAIQLQLFGAQIYIADIVGIAMVRVMGAVMTGVIMSGRTGASFAAELGIMQTNEEIDALRTLGVSPVEFLVLPRVLALVMMMPLLTLYADLMGIAGGFLVSSGMLNINPVEYLQHTKSAVKLSNLWVGLVHGIVFGVIIAVAGCLRGINCERSAGGVGEATTSAVVTAITSIVIATAIITFVCQILGV